MFLDDVMMQYKIGLIVNRHSSMSGNQPTGEKMEIAKRIEIAKKLEELEKDVQDLKTLILSEKNESLEKELISLRGIGKALVSEKELDEAIEKAKKSLFYGVENVVRD